MGLSTHVLDTSLGRPAAGITLTLLREEHDNWHTLNSADTDQDGRCKDLVGHFYKLNTGTYRIRFETARYFASHNIPTLYPYIEITFTVTNPHEHHHIPLLLTANGYTTYRGT
jgi:5-hydroxyisourate hydrolase